MLIWLAARSEKLITAARRILAAFKRRQN